MCKVSFDYTKFTIKVSGRALFRYTQVKSEVYKKTSQGAIDGRYQTVFVGRASGETFWGRGLKTSPSPTMKHTIAETSIQTVLYKTQR